jgi:hypothetical protein
MMSDMKGIVVSQTSHLLYKQMFDLRQAELAATNHVMTTGGPSADVRLYQQNQKFCPWQTLNFIVTILLHSML